MWFYAAILTSIVSAFSVIVSKKLIKDVSATVLTWATLVLATPVIFLIALTKGMPSLNYLFLVGVVGSVVFYTVSKVIGLRAMRLANLSTIYPLTSLSPLFTLLIAVFPPLNERPSTLALIGILTTLFGVYILNTGTVGEGLLKPIQSLFKNKAALLTILSVFIGSFIIVFDKIALNNTVPKNTTFTLLVENLLVILGLLPILYKRNKFFVSQISVNLKSFLLLGFLNALSTILAFSAVGGGDVGLVATIFQTQITVVLLFSYIMFGDKPRFVTILGSAVMILGVVLIKIGS